MLYTGFLVYNHSMEIILASASPRRKEILEKAGYEIKIIPSNYKEGILNQKYSDYLVENCAYQKAFDVKTRGYEKDIIIGADTVVVLNNKILGKPENKQDAFDMLKSLSDKTHFVATSICLIKGNNVKIAVDKTFVTFRKLTDKEINEYIKTKNPLDKAGSYGIQDIGFDFYTKIDGEIDNVIGFPLKLFESMLAFFN